MKNKFENLTMVDKVSAGRAPSSAGPKRPSTSAASQKVTGTIKKYDAQFPKVARYNVSKAKASASNPLVKNPNKGIAGIVDTVTGTSRLGRYKS